MARPDQQEPEPISEERFERAVRKLLDTPPKPDRGKKTAAKRKPDAKGRKKPSKG